MRPFEKKPKELRIEWTTPIENGQDRFSDSERTIGGPLARTQASPPGPALLDKGRTLLGKLSRRPSEGTDFIPDDRTRNLPV